MAEIDYSQVTGLFIQPKVSVKYLIIGIRFIVFMQGCKLRCQYCHSTQMTWARVRVNKAVELCTVEDVLEEALLPSFLGRAWWNHCVRW